MKVIISNGHFKFILGPAAAEANRRKILIGYITGGYPTSRVKHWISFFRGFQNSIVKRLLDREESIPEHLVHSLWFSEVIVQLAAAFRKISNAIKLPEALDEIGLLIYGYQASAFIRKSSAHIYHFRSGYGHLSAKIAKRQGMILLCDHSIAHPSICEFLVKNQGRFPLGDKNRNIGRFWSAILKDIDQSDHILVNSDFVKDTFIHQGWKEDLVHVIYTGIDNNFLNIIPKRDYCVDSSRPLRLMFAGDLGPRKGGEFLINALKNINDLPWQLEIVGSIDPVIRAKFVDFLSDQRVTISGYLSRIELAKHMSNAEVFLFPSLAEGSARVVFMALASGCFVITTPNSGSIVQNDIHGMLVGPGDVGALEMAIRKSLAMDRNKIRQIGKKNAEVIRSNYTQDQYGDRLLALYQTLITKVISNCA